MNNLANDLRIEGRIANDLLTESDQIINRHPAAMIAAATAEATRVVCDELIYSNVFVLGSLVASTCHHHEFEYPNSFLFF